MTENNDPGGGPANRVAPKRGRVELSDLTFIVRPPGRPAGIRTYTAGELDEAQAYADQTGGQVDQLS
ncbi:hypothetical protein MHN80_23435 [Gordonia McavH-238-E]|uniref:hypothetical protein n=1 Tax=Gordonia sp. McavH-238-E TaxID=2917736 RepID=UPI001EF48543|nr:hypothetical protein [Gordonia sp. McavH-238-E]MCG7635273.1 hypothetical protein [Gordonia sp. McavH-238-E]